MYVKRKIPFAIRDLAVAVAIATLGTHAGATLVADGKLGDAAVLSPHGTAAAALAEGYQFGYAIGFVDDKGKSMGSGQIWFGTAADGTQFLYVMDPTGYVDNTYGANAAADWTKGHTFKDLLNSDGEGQAVLFSWADQNNKGAITKGSIDYIADCSAATDAGSKAVCSPQGFASAGIGLSGTGVTEGANGGGAKWTQADTGLSSGSAASLLQVATSLEYNLRYVDTTATALTDSSLSPNWLVEVGYEYQFAKGTFDQTIWGDPAKAIVTINGSTNTPQMAAGLLQIGDFHVSPPKASLGSFTPPCLIGSPGCQVPEPGSLALIATGLAAAGWFTRRRRSDPGPKPPAMIVAT